MGFLGVSKDVVIHESLKIIQELFTLLIKKGEEVLIVHDHDVDAAVSAGIFFRYLHGRVHVSIMDTLTYLLNKPEVCNIIYLGVNPHLVKAERTLKVCRGSLGYNKVSGGKGIEITAPTISSISATIIREFTPLTNHEKYMLLIASLSNKAPLILKTKLLDDLEKQLTNELVNAGFLTFEKGLKIIGWKVSPPEYSLSSSLDPPFPGLLGDIDESKKFIENTKFITLDLERKVKILREYIKSKVSKFNIPIKNFIDTLPIRRAEHILTDIYEGIYSLTSLADTQSINRLPFTLLITAYITASLVNYKAAVNALSSLFKDLSNNIKVSKKTASRARKVTIVELLADVGSHIALCDYALKSLGLIGKSTIFSIDGEYVVSLLTTNVRYDELVRYGGEYRIKGCRVFFKDINKLSRVLA